MLSQIRFSGMNTAVSSDGPKDLYDIGAASRLTGLSAPNLRIWEKRYALVEPQRTESQRRMYTADDIKRLTLLKGLVDRGHSIGNIAQLSVEDLEARLREDKRLSGGEEEEGGAVIEGPCRISIVGSELQLLVEGHEEELGDIRVVQSVEDLEHALSAGATSTDLIFVQSPTLFPDTVARIQELVRKSGAFRAVVIYRFAERETAEQLRKGVEHLVALRAPVGLEELRLVCQAEIGLKARAADEAPAAPVGQVEPRYYTDRQLAVIAQASTVIDCECPRHLANVVRTLIDFETYSAECESRNAEDAALHRDLYVSTAAARAHMEGALRRLGRAEGMLI